MKKGSQTYLGKEYEIMHKDYGKLVDLLNNQEINLTYEEIESELLIVIQEGLLRLRLLPKENVKFKRVVTNGEDKVVYVEYLSEDNFVHLQFDIKNTRIRLVHKKGNQVLVRILSLESGKEDKVVNRLPNYVKEEVGEVLKGGSR